MTPREPRPSEERAPDLEIGATVRAKRLRFEQSPEAEVEFRGESIAESSSESERQNLPQEVKPNVTYRNVRVGWRAATWVDNAADEPGEDEPGPNEER
jgi:hypothetical protein